MRGHSFFYLPLPDETENKETFILLLHGFPEKQEKFCRIFIITKVQKYIIRVYF